MDLLMLINNLPSIIIALLGVSFLIFFHELGHFIFAKLFGVHTPSFSIGFGPRIFKKKIGDTDFVLSAIPMGGYVEMAGSAEVGQGEQAYAHSTDDRSFNQKPYWQKMLIMFGGILFNLIFAYAALSFLFYVGGPCIGSTCKSRAPYIDTVAENLPAAKAGFKPHDKIVSINHEPVTTIEQVTEKLIPFMGKQTPVEIERNGEKQTLTLELAAPTPNKIALPILGVYWHTPAVSFSQALSQGWQTTWNMIKELFGIFKGFKKAQASLGGPLMLIAQVTSCVKGGYKVCLFMLAFISINLAVFNMLPLPIFDGGQALFLTIEALLGKPLKDETRYKIHYITWLVVMGLIVYLTYRDLFTLLKF